MLAGVGHRGARKMEHAQCSMKKGARTTCEPPDESILIKKSKKLIF